MALRTPPILKDVNDGWCRVLTVVLLGSDGGAARVLAMVLLSGMELKGMLSYLVECCE
jgi:hypothetical protein